MLRESLLQHVDNESAHLDSPEMTVESFNKTNLLLKFSIVLLICGLSLATSLQQLPGMSLPSLTICPLAPFKLLRHTDSLLEWLSSLETTTFLMLLLMRVETQLGATSRFTS
jgi:hypothetical protein